MKKPIFAAIAALLLVSCQKDLVDMEYQKGQQKKEDLKEAVITAVFAHSKVSYSESTDNSIGDIILQPEWESGDIVFGFDDEGNTYSFSVSNISNGKATLRGDTPENTRLHLIHARGYSKDNIEGQGLTVHYDLQKGDKSMPAVMVADGEISDYCGEFTFDNAGAVLGITKVKGIPAGSVISNVLVRGDYLTNAGLSLKSGCLSLNAQDTKYDRIRTAQGFSVTVGSDGTLSSPVLIAIPTGAIIRTIYLTVGEDSYLYKLKTARTAAANDYLYIDGSQEFYKWEMKFIDIGMTDFDGNKILWAESNLGSMEAEDYGYYYEWGSVAGYKPEFDEQTKLWTFTFPDKPADYGDGSRYPKWAEQWDASKGFSPENCPYTNGVFSYSPSNNEKVFTKYIPTSDEEYFWNGTTEKADNKKILDPEDDPATVTNPEWITPRYVAKQQMYSQCYLEWCKSYNGMPGLIIYKSFDMSLDHGPYHNSGHQYSPETDVHVFLPATSFAATSTMTPQWFVGSCDLWTSEIYVKGFAECAYDLWGHGSSIPESLYRALCGTTRCAGKNIRPVKIQK